MPYLIQVDTQEQTSKFRPPKPFVESGYVQGLALGHTFSLLSLTGVSRSLKFNLASNEEDADHYGLLRAWGRAAMLNAAHSLFGPAEQSLGLLTLGPSNKQKCRFKVVRAP
jgi:hypothetical protein